MVWGLLSLAKRRLEAWHVQSAEAVCRVAYYESSCLLDMLANTWKTLERGQQCWDALDSKSPSIQSRASLRKCLCGFFSGPEGPNMLVSHSCRSREPFPRMVRWCVYPLFVGSMRGTCSTLSDTASRRTAWVGGLEQRCEGPQELPT